ncbi:MAG: ATP-binding protein [Bacteroidales bacterium]|nr:ATP-binding protein [Bacteroidales bacterium]MDT8431000.1 ATP-binding protein [Bacteroidales bacterium]
MSTFRFEYRITFAYLIIGALWIIFSDRAIDAFIGDKDLLTNAQTYKGWFYVLITAVLFFLFLKKHLAQLRRTESELEKHRDKLQELVMEKTKDLDQAVKDLYMKNEVINRQNEELRQALKDLQDTQAQLIQSDKMASLGVLTAGVAHEINNPLNYIAGGVAGLRSVMQECNTQNERTDLFLDSINQGIERISSIVSGLNNFSRNTDKYDEACNINEILEHCLVIIDSQLTNSISVARNFSDKPLVIHGNVGQLHQVFINVLLNALQSIENKGTITITTSAENHAAVVKIGDTGSGIEEENMSKITDPFFTTKAPGEGTGLGLSITYNIVKRHKGSISFKSEPNTGTVVTIELPV